MVLTYFNPCTNTPLKNRTIPLIKILKNYRTMTPDFKIKHHPALRDANFLSSMQPILFLILLCYTLLMVILSLFTHQAFIQDAFREVFAQLSSFSLKVNPERAEGDVILWDQESWKVLNSSTNPKNLPIICLGSSSAPYKNFPFPLSFSILLQEVLNLKSNKQQYWMIGESHFYQRQKLIIYQGTKIFLTDNEADILSYLCAHPEGASREALQAESLGYSSEAQTHAVETLLYRLRKKFTMLTNEEAILFKEGVYQLVQTPHLQKAGSDHYNEDQISEDLSVHSLAKTEL